ncbi:MAG: hypothetical protein M1820_005670 [Bogoriella megaspora]|nr:MAG: hypothetical protein M1820_005670 [Bogoriella megaspora]
MAENPFSDGRLGSAYDAMQTQRNADAAASSTSTLRHQNNQPKQAKVDRAVTHAACQACRKRRSKCDGTRPECRKCQEKRTPCVYDVEPGQTRVDALKSRNADLESSLAANLELFWLLKNCPRDERERIFEQVHSKEDITHVAALALSAIHTSHQHENTMTDNRQGPETMAADNKSPVSQNSSSNTTSPLLSEAQTRILEGQLGGSRIGRESYPSKFHLGIPNLDELRLALDAWSTCNGQVFYTFAQEEVDILVDAVRQNADQDALGAHLAVLCAISALGAQYSLDAFSSIQTTRFYNCAKLLLDNCMAQNPFHAMKAATILAMYNVFERATVTFVYLDFAMSMARQLGIVSKQRPPTMSQKQWLDSNKTLRTIACIREWIGASIGFLSNQPLLLDTNMLSTVKVDSTIEDNPTPASLLQYKFAKMAIIKGNFLRVFIHIPSLSSPMIAQMRTQLSKWYETLPAEMLLDQLFAGPGGGLEPAVGLLHLLNLGAIQLLNRMVLSTTLRGAKTPLTEPELVLAASQSVQTAGQGAQLLTLLMEHGHIFKKCWLVVYQSYIFACFLLYATTKKILHGFSAQNYSEDIIAASKCLRVLEYCSSADTVALKLFHTVNAYYLFLARTSPADLARLAYIQSSDVVSDMPTASAFNGSYLIVQPPGNSTLHLASNEILQLLCQPFAKRTSGASTPEFLPNLPIPSTHGIASLSEYSLLERTVLGDQVEWTATVRSPKGFSQELTSLSDGASDPSHMIAGNSFDLPQIELPEGLSMPDELKDARFIDPEAVIWSAF